MNGEHELRAALQPPEDLDTRRGRLRALLADAAWRRRVLIILTIVTLLLVSGLAALVSLVSVLPIDLWATRELQEHPRELLFQTMYAISIFGYQPWAAVTVVAGALLVGIWLGWRTGAYLLALVIIQGLVNAAIKLLIGRPRPIGSLVDVIVPEQGNSFPSGHVMFYTVFFGMLCFLAWTHLQRPWQRWPAVIVSASLVVLIGVSRMTLGSHWLSDVIAAYLLGLLLLALGIEGYATLVAPQIFALPSAVAAGDSALGASGSVDPTPPKAR